MAASRSTILRSIGRGAGGKRFPWAGRPVREPRREEPSRYRCRRCKLRFKMAGLQRPCPECGGAVIAVQTQGRFE